MPANPAQPDPWVIVGAIAAALTVLITLLIFLFDQGIVLRLKNRLAKRARNDSPNTHSDGSAMMMTTLLELVTEAEGFVSEAKGFIPNNPPVVPEDIKKIHIKLTEARDKIQMAASSINITTDIRLTLEAMIKPSSRPPDYHFDRALTSSFKLAEYARSKNYDVDTVSEELITMRNLISQVQTRLGNIKGSLSP